MLATVFILSIITASMAMPTNSVRQTHKEHRYGDITVAQAQESCGDHQTISCCNKSSGDGNSGGALSGLLDNGLLGECAKLDIALLIGVQDLLDDNCNGQVACCKDNNAGVIIFAVLFEVLLTDYIVVGPHSPEL